MTFSRVAPGHVAVPSTTVLHADTSSSTRQASTALVRVTASGYRRVVPGSGRRRQDLGAVVGDHQGVFELRGPALVLGGDGPAVAPDLVVQRAEIDHGFDGEGHARLQNSLDGRLIV